MQNTQPQHAPLWQRYLTTKAQSSAKYARDIAAEMGISEAELTEARQATTPYVCRTTPAPS